MPSKIKKFNIPERRRAAREAAMPEVKRLVRKYGRRAVVGCLTQLREYERKLQQLAQIKAEAARLERELA